MRDTEITRPHNHVQFQIVAICCNVDVNSNKRNICCSVVFLFPPNCDPVRLYSCILVINNHGQGSDQQNKKRTESGGAIISPGQPVSGVWMLRANIFIWRPVALLQAVIALRLL